MLVIGIDEAGYGPNLGPLVIGASAWWVHEGSLDLYALLGEVVCCEPDDVRLALADSKALYSSGDSLSLLERGVLSIRRAGGIDPRSDLLSSLLGRTLVDLPWYTDYDPALPVDACTHDITQCAGLLSAMTGAIPLGVWARAIEPRELNTGCMDHGTKGALLSAVSIELARDVVTLCLGRVQAPLTNVRGSKSLEPRTLVSGVGVRERAVASERVSSIRAKPTRGRLNRKMASPAHRVRIQFDKHGGRNFYAGLLQHHFACDWIEPQVESRAESRYTWQREGAHFTATFCAGGESQLPTAVASMTAKYVRELCMRAFNQFWCLRVPDLRPTAGYPGDARRFKTQISREQVKLGIDDADLWRLR